MSDKFDLLERLWKPCEVDQHYGELICGLRVLAIEEIKTLRAENEKLRAALKPFADMVDYCTGTKDDDWMDAVFKLGEVRAAAAALKETGDE